MTDTAVFTAGRENTPTGRKRGYADWRPQAKTRVLLAQVDDVLEEYEARSDLLNRLQQGDT